jgi:hypothetical protein
MIKDSRNMHGPQVETEREIRALWSEWAIRHHGAYPEESGLSTRAYISEGRWVANCPSVDCNGGLAVWHEMAQGCCYDCNSIHDIEFPPVAELKQAEAILLHRPVVNRHWDPLSEGIDDLKAENALHGFSWVGEA